MQGDLESSSDTPEVVAVGGVGWEPGLYIDCTMPDGGDGPCKAFRALAAERDALLAVARAARRADIRGGNVYMADEDAEAMKAALDSLPPGTLDQSEEADACGGGRGSRGQGRSRPSP